MPRRIILTIDKLSHINDVTFEVYRSTNPDVNDNSPLIMKVFDPLTVKHMYREITEPLVRDPDTPYAFYVSRHFEAEPFPEVYIGSELVLPRDIALFPEQKSIEIHNGDLGVSDGRSLYMSYDYQAISIKDDNVAQSGVEYFGPIAAGLRKPKLFNYIHDQLNKKLQLHYEPDLDPVTYFYKIKAVDSDGNESIFSKEHSINLIPNTSELFYYLERSIDGKTWEAVGHLKDLDYVDDIYVVDAPLNVQNIVVTPVGSKVTNISFDNPWYYWNTYNRKLYQYRLRLEDYEGEVGEYIYLDVSNPIYLKPKEVLIRRKINNNAPSTKDGTDAFDVFRLTESDVDVNSPRIELVDNQLNEERVYGYTFFYTDEINKEAKPEYRISDNTLWDNFILYPSDTIQYDIADTNFITRFKVKG